MVGRITICNECGYSAITWDIKECSKCGGKLEIIASTDKNEIDTLDGLGEQETKI